MSDNNEINLSPEEIAALEHLNEAAANIQKLQDDMDNLPTNEGPSLDFRLPGAPPSNKAASKARKEYDLKTGIENQKTKAAEKIAEISENASPDIKNKLAWQMVAWQSHYQDKTLEKDDEISPAQGRVAKMYGKAYRRPDPNTPVVEKWMANRADVRVGKNEDTIAVQYGRHFSYFTQPDVGDIGPSNDANKTNEPEIDLDRDD